MRRIALLTIGLELALSCGPNSAIPEQETLCDPGSFVFCRCPGGQPGTKECDPDGRGFAACFPESGEPCPDRPEEVGGGGSSSSSMGGFGGGGPGGAGPGTKELFEPCASDVECKSGRCPLGACTKDCFKVDDCPFGQAECINFASEQVCMPTCGTVKSPTPDDCLAYGGLLECGFTPAID